MGSQRDAHNWATNTFTFWILQRLPLSWKYPKSFKSYFFKRPLHMEVNLGLLFSSGIPWMCSNILGLLIWWGKTNKLTPQTMLAWWFLPWYGSSAWAWQRKAGSLLVSPPEPAPRISSLLRSLCQELEQDIKFFSTPKKAISSGRQV